MALIYRNGELPAAAAKTNPSLFAFHIDLISKLLSSITDLGRSSWTTLRLRLSGSGSKDKVKKAYSQSSLGDRSRLKSPYLNNNSEIELKVPMHSSYFTRLSWAIHCSPTMFQEKLAPLPQSRPPHAQRRGINSRRLLVFQNKRATREKGGDSKF